MSVIALIPAYDEEARVGATVRAAASVPGIDRVLVIDDGSRDATARVAEDAGAEVLRLHTNAGKGGALQMGIDLIAHDADTLVLLDADLGETADQAGALLTPVLAGESDMTVAVLPRPAGSGGFGLVKGLARRGIRALTGLECSAPLSGQRALSRAAWQAALPIASGFGVEVALTVRVARAGLRILEVPAPMRHAATGKDFAGFAHRGRQFIAVARTLLGLATERPPRP